MADTSDDRAMTISRDDEKVFQLLNKAQQQYKQYLEVTQSTAVFCPNGIAHRTAVPGFTTLTDPLARRIDPRCAGATTNARLGPSSGRVEKTTQR